MCPVQSEAILLLCVWVWLVQFLVAFVMLLCYTLAQGVQDNVESMATCARQRCECHRLRLLVRRAVRIAVVLVLLADVQAFRETDAARKLRLNVSFTDRTVCDIGTTTTAKARRRWHNFDNYQRHIVVDGDHNNADVGPCQVIIAITTSSQMHASRLDSWDKPADFSESMTQFQWW
jgi:hypothetical protein